VTASAKNRSPRAAAPMSFGPVDANCGAHARGTRRDASCRGSSSRRSEQQRSSGRSGGVAAETFERLRAKARDVTASDATMARLEVRTPSAKEDSRQIRQPGWGGGGGAPGGRRESASPGLLASGTRARPHAPHGHARGPLGYIVRVPTGPSVVDQHIPAAEAIDRRVHKHLELFTLAYVGCEASASPPSREILATTASARSGVWRCLTTTRTPAHRRQMRLPCQCRWRRPTS
jgi:hypothetical protein